MVGARQPISICRCELVGVKTFETNELPPTYRDIPANIHDKWSPPLYLMLLKWDEAYAFKYPVFKPVNLFKLLPFARRIS